MLRFPLGVNEGTLGNWVNKDIERRLPSNGGVSETERDELARLRRENAELVVVSVIRCYSSKQELHRSPYRP